jgi:protoporphyrinogen oxidase
LPVNPLITVNLGFAKKDTNQFTAVYIPDDEYLVNRLSFPGVFSPENVPSENHMLIQAEITVTESSDVWGLSDDFLITHVLDGLRSRNLLLQEDKPIFQNVERIKDAYVVYPNNFEKHRQEIYDYYATQDILLNGRFGSHNYLNVDGILEQSIGLAQKFEKSLDTKEIRLRFGLSPSQLSP